MAKRKETNVGRRGGPRIREGVPELSVRRRQSPVTRCKPVVNTQRGADGGLVGEVQEHAADVGLVGNRGHRELGDDGLADLGGDREDVRSLETSSNGMFIHRSGHIRVVGADVAISVP